MSNRRLREGKKESPFMLETRCVPDALRSPTFQETVVNACKKIFGNEWRPHLATAFLIANHRWHLRPETPLPYLAFWACLDARRYYRAEKFERSQRSNRRDGTPPRTPVSLTSAEGGECHNLMLSKEPRPDDVAESLDSVETIRRSGPAALKRIIDAYLTGIETQRELGEAARLSQCRVSQVFAEAGKRWHKLAS